MADGRVTYFAPTVTGGASDTGNISENGIIDGRSANEIYFTEEYKLTAKTQDFNQSTTFVIFCTIREFNAPGGNVDLVV